jgi:hypothetical protein
MDGENGQRVFFSPYLPTPPSPHTSIEAEGCALRLIPNAMTPDPSNP